MNNEGVTILQIVITLIVMLIILSVTIFYGQGTTREAKLAATYSEMKEIENTLKEARLLNKITRTDEGNINLYNEIELKKINPEDYVEQLGGAASGDYYYMDFTSSRKLENVLELEKVKNDYLFDLENLNIYLIDGIDIGDTIEYNSDEISNYYNNTFVK